VVHERPGVAGLELVDEVLAGLDRAHLVVPGDLAGMQVDRVVDGPVVDQVIVKRSPTWPRRVVPGTLPSKVHIFWVRWAVAHQGQSC